MPHGTAGRWPGPQCPMKTECSPPEQMVQHLLGGGKSSIIAQKCVHIGGVATQDGRHQLCHQLLQPVSLEAPSPVGFIPAP